MKLEQSFDVAAPIERVWEALVDVEYVAPCLPGAAISGRNDDGSYNGSFTLKIGPTSASYAGRLSMDEIDEAARTATMQASGTDKRGQGGARATIVSTLTERDGATHVEVATDYHITGRLARFGRGGMIEDISQRLLREFAARLQDSLTAPDGGAGAGEAAPPTPGPGGAASAPLASVPRPVAPAPAEPIQGPSLVSGVVLDRIKRNPAPFIAAVIVLLGLLGRRRGRRRRRGPLLTED
jgi:carbon monoxide dehydrogenase subunit G